MFAAIILVVASAMLAAPVSEPQQAGQGGRDELIGASSIVAAPLPPGLTGGDRALRTLRQGKDFGYRLAVPSGAYDLEMAFVELLYRRPRQRLFDVVANERIVFPAIDPVALAGPAPVVVTKKTRVEVSKDGLRIAFRASSDQAAVAWIRLTAQDGQIVRSIDCGGDTDLEPVSATAPLSEQILPIFGSRAFLDLRPQWGDAEVSARGKFAEKPEALLVGFETGGVTYALPFARSIPAARPFDSVTETRTVTSLRYDVEFAGRLGSIVFRAPFDPGDLVASATPVFVVEFSYGPSPDPHAAPVKARVALATPGGAGAVSSHEAVFASPTAPSRALVVSRVEGEKRDERAIVLDPLASSAATLLAAPRAIQVTLPLAEFEDRKIWIALYSDRPVVNEGSKAYASTPASRHRSVDSMLASYFCTADRLLEASRVIDSLVERATIPEAVKALLRVAIPSFLLNTCDAYAADGTRFYSCIEGFCRYHATLDVELHTSAFYAWFAPELLALEIERWAATVQPDDVMCHDVGKDDVIGAPQYPHAMPIEENTNFVILLHAYWTRTGDDAFVRRHAPLVQRLLARVRRADVDGDGLAESDVANTLDDASAAVQYSRGQTYLAVKTAAAHLFGAEILELLSTSAAPDVATCRAYAKTIAATLEQKSWRGTHYAVTADRSAKGLLSPWAAKRGTEAGPVPAEVANAEEAEELEGADSANGLAALGVLDALRGNSPSPLPLERVKLDLTTASPLLERRFVLAHAEHEVNGWVSTAIVRDAVRIYLGDDPLSNSERYALLESRRNRQSDLPDWAGFCDSPFNRYLSYYPRGVVALTLVDALAGSKIDRRKHVVELAPMKVPCELPLPSFADWDHLVVPWLVVNRAADGSLEASIEHGERLADCDVTIDLRAHGGARIELPRGKR